MRGGVRIEGSEGQRVLVHGEEIGGVLGRDELTQRFFLRGVDVRVRVRADVVAGFLEEGFCFREGDAGGFGWCVTLLGGRGKFEGAGVWVAGGADDGGEILAFGVGGELVEEMQHQVFAEGEDFVVVLANGHFEVQAGELGQVAFGVGILGAEDGANAVDGAQVAGDGHLLEELRGLSQVGFAVEVGDFEDA